VSEATLINRLRERGSVAVVAPHPDDEVFGCGGLTARLTDINVPVTPYVLSDGEAIERQYFDRPPGPETDLGAHRREEAKTAARILGAEEPAFLSFPDGGLLSESTAVVERLAALLGSSVPGTILAPWPGEQHADHVAASWIAGNVARRLDRPIVFYEVNTPLRPTEWIDIAAVLDRKRDAVMAYPYSLYGRPEVFWDAIKGLNAYRAFFFMRRGWFEAFATVESPEDKKTLDRWLEPVPVFPVGGPWGIPATR